MDDEDYYGGQISLKWMATDNLSITPKFMYQKIEADGLPFADIDAENMETPATSIQRSLVKTSGGLVAS